MSLQSTSTGAGLIVAAVGRTRLRSAGAMLLDAVETAGVRVMKVEEVAMPYQ